MKCLEKKPNNIGFLCSRFCYALSILFSFIYPHLYCFLIVPICMGIMINKINNIVVPCT